MVDVKNKMRGRPPAFDRQKVVAAAMRVFWATGYREASLPLLTDAMGISAQSLYAAFGSKEALYREAMDMYRTTDGGFPTDALSDAHAITALQRLVKDAAVAFARPETPGCMIAIAPDGDADGTLTTFGRELRAIGVARIADRLVKGVADGQVRSDADTAAWARFIASIVQGLSSQARDGHSPAMLQSTAEAASDAIAFLNSRL